MTEVNKGRDTFIGFACGTANDVLPLRRSCDVGSVTSGAVAASQTAITHRVQDVEAVIVPLVIPNTESKEKIRRNFSQTTD